MGEKGKGRKRMSAGHVSLAGSLNCKTFNLKLFILWGQKTNKLELAHLDISWKRSKEKSGPMRIRNIFIH